MNKSLCETHVYSILLEISCKNTKKTQNLQKSSCFLSVIWYNETRKITFCNDLTAFLTKAFEGKLVGAFRADRNCVLCHFFWRIFIPSCSLCSAHCAVEGNARHWTRMADDPEPEWGSLRRCSCIRVSSCDGIRPNEPNKTRRSSQIYCLS